MNRSFLIVLIYTLTADVQGVQPNCDSFLMCVTDIHCDCINRCFGNTFFSFRPQDSNSARRLLNIAQEKGHDKYSESLEWGFNFSWDLQQSFARNNNILSKWFLFNGASCVTVGIPEEGVNFDVDGQQLGLTTSSNAPDLGILSLNPATKNNVVDFYFWFDLNSFVHGLWIRSDLTAVATTTRLNVCTKSENVAQVGNYPEGFYTIDCTSIPLAYTNIFEAFIGDSPIGVVPSLNFDKFFCCSLNRGALASIRFDVGFDVVKSPAGFLTLSGCVLAPTGTRPTARFILEPVVGSNKSWQVGAELAGAYHRNTHISLYSDVTLSHLFKATQTRVFGLINGPGSQYLLLKEFDINIGAIVGAERVANILAGETKIGAAIMVDASFMAHCTYDQFFFDIGYNFWMRSHETIADTVCFRNFSKDTFGIKGDTVLSEVDPFSGLCIGNLETESTSTIGQPGSVDPNTVFVNVCDIDFGTALHPSAYSNKIFGSLGFVKRLDNQKCACDTFNLAFRWGVEFGQQDKAIDQWNVGLALGASF